MPQPEKLKELLEAKVQGREIVAPTEEPEPHVINLMDALEASVQEGRSRDTNGSVRTGVRATPRSSRLRRAVSRRRAAKARSKRAS